MGREGRSGRDGGEDGEEGGRQAGEGRGALAGEGKGDRYLELEEKSTAGKDVERKMAWSREKKITTASYCRKLSASYTTA